MFNNNYLSIKNTKYMIYGKNPIKYCFISINFEIDISRSQTELAKPDDTTQQFTEFIKIPGRIHCQH